MCRFLLGESLERGVRLHHPAKAVSVAQDVRGELASVRIKGEAGSEVDSKSWEICNQSALIVEANIRISIAVPCTRLIITAGAWTPRVYRTLFPISSLRIPVSSLAGHSLIVRSPRWAKEHEVDGCHAIFTTDPAGYSPEVFSRMGGEIYIAGLNDENLALPEMASDAEPDADSIATLMTTAKRMLGLRSGVEDLEVTREGLCFRPVTARGTPIIWRVPDVKLGNGWKTRGGGDGGVFISAGHGPWGISHSLGTGKVLAELVEGKKPSANIKSLGL